MANRRSPKAARAPIRNLDMPLVLVVILLSLIGAVAIFSATRTRLEALGRDPHHFVKRQLAFLGLALLVFLITVLFDYRQLRGLAPLLYLGGVVLLLLVLSPVGRAAAGAQRWINLGPVQVQPSEIMKVILIAALAALYAEERTGGLSWKLAVAGLAVALPAWLVSLQPDLGTVMVLAAIAFSVLIVTKTKVRW
ncbi:MAG: FtsW/RodA/SpoVE family cell cycle protein, partial [Actinomycetota bacterium]